MYVYMCVCIPMYTYIYLYIYVCVCMYGGALSPDSLIMRYLDPLGSTLKGNTSESLLKQSGSQQVWSLRAPRAPLPRRLPEGYDARMLHKSRGFGLDPKIGPQLGIYIYIYIFFSYIHIYLYIYVFFFQIYLG